MVQRAALLFGLLSVLLFPVAQAGLSYDARLDWKTVTSRHFAVHYHEGEEALAEMTIAIAERVHAKLSPLFQWTPAGLTDIVLSDQVDFHNGSATAFPANRITLYTSTPDEVEGLEDHAGALETVITHEYVHLLQMDKASGAPWVLRQIFGRFLLFFPGMLQPAWLLEGLATYYETDPTRAIGRGQSSYFAM
ncbi:MAG: WD-40 repeat-containing protein, partial [Halothiobacillaceae bacterium]